MNRAALLAAVRDVIEVLDRHAEREGEVRTMLEGDEVTEMRRVLAEAEEIHKVLDCFDSESTLNAAKRRMKLIDSYAEELRNQNGKLCKLLKLLGLADRGSDQEVFDTVRDLQVTLSIGPSETALDAAKRLRQQADKVHELHAQTVDLKKELRDILTDSQIPLAGLKKELCDIAELIGAQPDDVVGAVERLRDRAVKLAHDVDTHDRYDAEIAGILGDNDGPALGAARNAAATIKELLRRLEQKNAP